MNKVIHTCHACIEEAITAYATMTQLPQLGETEVTLLSNYGMCRQFVGYA